MSERLTHGYCDACRQDSAIDARGRCLWCDGPTRQRAKRGGWKRPNLRGSRYSDAQLRALHVAHLRGQSLNALAEQTYEAVGYGSQGSAVSAISREWKRRGLRALDRIESTVRASTKHGRAPREGRDNAAYRRWFKAQNDRYQPLCVGVKRQAPRKGEPCQRPAIEDSDYCQSHDPSRELARQAHLVRVRARQPVKAMVPMAPFAAWLRRRRDELGTFTVVADRVELSKGLVGAYADGKRGRRKLDVIGRDVVQRCLDADGTATFEDLYPREQHDGRAPSANGEEPASTPAPDGLLGITEAGRKALR